MNHSPKQFIIKNSGNARDVALFALLGVSENGKKSHVYLRETLDRNSALDTRDKAFCEHMVSGTLDHLYGIDEILGSYSSTPVDRMNPYIRGILRLSVCQLLYMDRVPDAAVLNEAAELAKSHGLKGLTGFVNGILRNVARDRKSEEKDTKLRRLMEEGSIRWSVPRWLYSKFLLDFGKEGAEKIFSAWLTLRRVSVRMNLSLGKTEAEICAMLEEEGIPAFRIEAVPPVYELDGLTGLGVASLRAFREGYITVQDASAALLLRYCPAEPGSRILDLCAAPGGKTLCYADALNGTGLVDSRDISEQKTALIRENAQRCGFSNICVSLSDASEKKAEDAGSFDIVIADLPCSGLGVVAKKPDIKKNITPETILELRQLQRKILENAAAAVKPGGRLVYSTCTVTREENEQNAWWAAETLGLKPLQMERIMPDSHHDGFFIAVFLKPLQVTPGKKVLQNV